MWMTLHFFPAQTFFLFSHMQKAKWLPLKLCSLHCRVMSCWGVWSSGSKKTPQGSWVPLAWSLGTGTHGLGKPLNNTSDHEILP
jgi:hypothetical protein